MIATELGSRRIITIDDNEEIHNDFRSILCGSSRANNLMDLEDELFGSRDREPDPAAPFDHEFALQGVEGVLMIEKAAREGNPFALAFVDMRMPPGLDGLETIRRIWSVDPQIQIVICTAYSDYSAEEITRRFRCSDSLLILKKPFDAAEVIQLANALTQKWALARQAALRTAELREIVTQRTFELQESNRKLLGEVALRRIAEEQLRALSRTDALTGVHNRRALDQYLRDVWEERADASAPLSLLLVDIDNFKKYNDEYGHLAGDECLRTIAKRIALATSRTADMVARYGGEEFILVMPNTSADGARHVAELILESVRTAAIPHGSSSVAPTVTVSIGCATYESPEQGNSDALIHKADESLYRAKRNGKNGIDCLT